MKFRTWAIVIVASVPALGSNCSDAGPAEQGGTTLWHVDGSGTATPSFDQTAVFFPGSQHTLTAVEKQTGLVRWQRQFPAGDRPELLDSTAMSGIVVAGGLVIARDVGVISGFDPATGAVRWTFEPPAEARRTFADPAGDGETVFLANRLGSAYALDGATGTVRWQSTIAKPSSAPYDPIPAGPDVYFRFVVGGGNGPGMPNSGGVASVRASTGEINWVHNFPLVPSLAEFAVIGSLLIAPVEGGSLYALNRTTGDVVWQRKYDGLAALTASSTKLFAGFASGAVLALDPVDGHESWRYTKVTATVGTISTDEQNVFVLHYGPLVALDAATGVERWHRGPTGCGICPPEEDHFEILSMAVDGDRVYASAAGHGYYAFRK